MTTTGGNEMEMAAGPATSARSRALATGIGLLVLALTCLLALWSSEAEGFAGLNVFQAKVSTSQAGGHPDVDIKLRYDTRQTQGGEEVPQPPGTCFCGDVRIIDMHFPTGFIGNPHAVTRCPLDVFAFGKCPPESQVGIFELEPLFQVPLYNMEPHENEPGLLGFNLPLLEGPTFIVLKARTGSDYGLDATSTPIFRILPLDGFDIFMWGVPAAAEHDKNRFPAGEQQCIQNPYPGGCFPPQPSNIPAEPFLQNPTTCGSSLAMGLDLFYYDGPLIHGQTGWPTTTGCDLLSFNPSLSGQPTSRSADSPAGLDVNLKVPQVQSPTVPTPSQLREVTVTLPDGLTINPSVADGKQACTDAQANLTSEAPAECPEHSKVGTVRLDSSALPGPINGAIYLGTPLPGDPYPILLTASGFATNVKLRGSTRTDPATGQVVVEFPDLPQSPLTEFDMHFFGSERGLLSTPERCGTYPVHSEFVPWNSVLDNQQSTSFFTIDSGPDGRPCPGPQRPFSPRLEAGSADNTAGSHTPFRVRIDRDDGDQLLSSIDVATPPGFSASLRGIPYCPEAALTALAAGREGLDELAIPSCPQASQIGVANTTEGAGSQPVRTPGRVFLAGPYRGAPLSLAVVVPALAGPYDLGTVLNRIAIHVNPVTAQITALSDPLPVILEGIPLRIRTVALDLDRPAFTLNPTNCDPFLVQGGIRGGEGGVATPAAHFQVANCTDRPFRPKLGLRLTGSMKRRGHPALQATVTAAPGESNIARAVVSLPPRSLLDNDHIGTVCTKVQYAADACPPDSVYGSATAVSPLLDQPLSGPVYLRSSNNKLPDLVASLRGQVDIELSGRIDTTKQDALRTTFTSLPDVPISSFTLSMLGGSKGLLVNSAALCKSRQRARVSMVGQNDVRSRRSPVVRTGCGSSSSRKRKHARVSQARKAG